MSELSSPLRNRLGKVIVEARNVAEAGAKKALQSLAVERHEPHGSMTPEERALRVRLRAHGRQLGDVRDRQRGNQSIGRLSHEVAYEHWHRMLFARFLAENGLLIHPKHQVAMSVRDVEELAHETGQDPHQLAASFAQGSLPQIFRTGDPVLEVTLAPETRQKLEALLDNLPTEVFTADDSLGWTYQYWQAEKKDAVNASGEKIGADELPAVTQLFTEHYMVLFLYHNTLGAWHAGKALADNPSLAESAQSEDELRQAVKLQTADAGSHSWDYLRFVREPQEGDDDDNPTGPWRPAAGTFDGWPKTAKELKVLDPCCGSGHFLVAGFKLLTRLRMLEESLSIEDAINGVLQDNLFGLEIDPRCTQIAAFNLALAAWRWVGKPIELPALNIACSGLSIGSSKKDWLALAGDDERLQAGLSDLYELFRQAPELGSLIDPKSLGDDLFVANFEELQPLLQEALAKESANEETIERAVAAQGMARAAELLASEYTLVITNVPYLGRGQHSDALKNFADRYYRATKSDLATMFVGRFAPWLNKAGTAAAITPQSWLFQPTFSPMREAFLSDCVINMQARLGPGAFRAISGEVVNVALLSWSKCTGVPASFEVVGVDASLHTSLDEKARALTTERLVKVNQVALKRGPDHRILMAAPAEGTLLGDLAIAPQGIKTGDDSRFRRLFTEIESFNQRWRPLQGAPETTRLIDGATGAVDWSLEGRNFARLQGKQGWNKNGVVLRLMGKVVSTMHTGELFDSNVTVIVPADASNVDPIYCYCQSEAFPNQLRLIEQGIKLNNATTVKVPFDLDHWQEIAAENFPNGLPEPYSNDPTQWLFHGHPANAERATALQIAVGRLLGYRWPPELDAEMRLADEARAWAARCEELESFADDDGIVCLPAIRSERPAADRLRSLLAAAFGSDWSAAKERELLAAAAGDGNKPAASLDMWLRDKFFEEHCKLFHHRPFIWHIWDGNRDGFHCLVNAHKLTGPDGEGRRTLEAIAYAYLGDWIQRQKDDQKIMVEGADARLAAAQDLQEQLVNLLKGEPPYDLFVRWKPLHEQAIGWEPDINDGVRLNIRPVMNAELRKGGKKGAGILRWKPNIKWKKDRGKEPESLRPMDDFPWFWGCNGDGSTADRTDYTAARAGNAKFDGNRWNDLHYTRATKEGARAAVKKQSQDTNK